MVTFINATKLEEYLEDVEKFPELRKAIRGFWRAASVAGDLYSALEALDTMDTLQGDREKLKLFGKAIMSHAVTLYSRATHSDAPGRRGHIGATKGYSDEQKETHDALIALRNQVIAHAGITNHVVSRTWWIEAAHIIEEDDGFLIGFTSKQAMDNVVLRRRFRDVLNKALQTSVTKRNVARDTLSEEWNRHGFHPEIRAVLGSFIDTYENFHDISEEQAIEMLSNPRHKDPAPIF